MNVLDHKAIIGRETLGDELASFSFVRGDDVSQLGICPMIIKETVALVFLYQGPDFFIVNGDFE